jgi:hypothetical protein
MFVHNHSIYAYEQVANKSVFCEVLSEMVVFVLAFVFAVWMLSRV